MNRFHYTRIVRFCKRQFTIAHLAKCSPGTLGNGETKKQAVQEMGINPKQGCNGNLISREAGSVGGQMVKKMCPIRSVEIREG